MSKKKIMEAVKNEEIKTPSLDLEGRLITHLELAERLGVHHTTLTAMKEKGLPFFPVPGKRGEVGNKKSFVRYYWPDVLTWIRSFYKAPITESEDETKPSE